MQFSPSLGECHGCDSSLANPAKPPRMAGGTEAILRYLCLHGLRAPGSYLQLLWTLLTPARIAPGRFEEGFGNCQVLHVRCASIPQVRA